MKGFDVTHPKPLHVVTTAEDSSAESIWESMLAGWGELLTSRHIRQRHSYLLTVRAFRTAVGGWPWTWTSADFVRWSASLDVRPSTFRSYQSRLRSFSEYLCDESFEWPGRCQNLFGRRPSPLCPRHATLTHSFEADSDPGRRALSDGELQQLFDASEDLVRQARASGRKGALSAYRDTVALHTTFGWGLRANEVAHLDISDFRRNPELPEFGEFGSVRVRFGKGRGGVYKRRTVLTVFEWPTTSLATYLREVRPLFADAAHGDLFLTERGTQIQSRTVSTAFLRARIHASLPSELTLHCLRHTYASKLAEMRFDHSFVQEQLGHSFASTTAVYTHLPTDFRITALADHFARHFGESETRG